MKKLFWACSVLLVGGVALSWATDAKTPSKSTSTKQIAVIKTSDGTMQFDLWPDVAPKTVANFTTLANKGFYDGTAFHRIIKGFMIQGGDPLTKDPANKARYGEGGPGYTIPDEFSNRPHVFGVISMAHTSQPHSAGSQFFICLGDAPWLNGKYADFGKLIKGADVLHHIGNTPTVPNAMGEKSMPAKRIEVKSIRVVSSKSLAKKAS